MKHSILVFVITVLCLLASCSAPPEKQSTTQETLYTGVLESYRDFIFAVANDPERASSLFVEIFDIPSDDSEDIWNNLNIGLSVAVLFGNAHGIDYNKQNLGYAIKDLNQDGVPELVLLTNDYFIMGVFTIADDNPRLLDGYWNRYTCKIDSSGLFYVHRDGGASRGEYTVQQISSERLQLIDLMKYVHNSNYVATDNGNFVDSGFYKVIDGTRYEIDESEMQEFWDDVFAISNEDAGFEFLLLFDDSTK